MTQLKFPVEAGHIMMFARAVGDKNKIYCDEEYAKSTEPGAVIAPPTFVRASAQFDPDYLLRPKIGREWFGSAKGPTGLSNPPEGGFGSGGFQTEQNFEYHQPLKAGDVLTFTTKPGRTWEKQRRRGGKLNFSEAVTEYRNRKGELVVTARRVSAQIEKSTHTEKTES